MSGEFTLSHFFVIFLFLHPFYEIIFFFKILFWLNFVSHQSRRLGRFTNIGAIPNFYHLYNFIVFYIFWDTFSVQKIVPKV